MNGVILAALLQSSVLAAEPISYEQAYAETEKTGKPLVVLVGAEWCPACKVMKNTTLPKAKQDDVFEQVSFATIDSDRERDIAKQLTGGGVIPQLLMFQRTADGWQKSRLVGAQSATAVVQFLRKGVGSAAAAGAN